MERNKFMILNRIKGALYGVAIGDALGGPLEFMTAEGIHKKHGTVTEMIGGGWLNLYPGETTDDTAMTLAVAQGIAENPADPLPAIGRRFIDWYKSGPKDIGGTCAMAIEKVMRMNSNTAYAWLHAGVYVKQQLGDKNAGNGALMRTVYTGLFYADPKERAIMTEKIGSMTHRNETSSDICIIYADAVHKALFGGHPAYTLLRDLNRSTDPTGYVLDSMCNATQAICSTETFEEAIIDAVNRGGDADTIGAITGGLAGAWYGYNNIPDRWIHAMAPELQEELNRLAEIAYNENERYYRSGRKGVLHHE